MYYSTSSYKNRVGTSVCPQSLRGRQSRLATLSISVSTKVSDDVASKPGSPEGVGREGKESLVHTDCACVKL